jgi:hypothetical protein
MQPLPRPFGTAGRASDVVWPQWTGPSTEHTREHRPPELWERRPEAETAAGERVLADLDTSTNRTDALLIVARYLIVRIARHTDQPAVEFNESAERTAALEYIDAIPGGVAEARWLRGILDACGNRVSRTLVSRLSAAAAVAGRRGHDNGAFALRYTAWQAAVRNEWHADAARIARAIAAAAERGGGPRSKRLWTRRARVHERRAAE